MTHNKRINDKNIKYWTILNLVSIIIALTFVMPLSLAANPGKAPEAFSFNAPTGTNVDLFTGDMSFSVPLFTVQSTGGFNVPLSLSYAAGIPVGTEASWVGLGWYFSPGSITRDVSGIPDDYFSENNPNNRVIAITGAATAGAGLAGDSPSPSSEGGKGLALITGMATADEVSTDSKYIKALQDELETISGIMQQDTMAKMGHAGESAAWDFGGDEIGYGGGYTAGGGTGLDDGFFYTLGCSANPDRIADCATPDSYKATAPGLNSQMIIVGNSRNTGEDSTKRFAMKNPEGRIVEGREDPVKVELSRNPRGDFIGFIVTDKSGLKYYFDYPLYHVNRNGGDATETGDYCDADHVFQRTIAPEINHNQKKCDIFRQKYAYAWLLTKMEDTNGNQIRFIYEKYDTAFRFRNPFGPSHGPAPAYDYRDGPDGELFQSNDGVLAAEDGWMELAYLKEIDTPAQNIKFIVSNRDDAVEFDDKEGEVLGFNEPASRFIGTGRKKKLDRVEVYAKDENQALHHQMSYVFTYDYRLANGIPDTVSNRIGDKGKLTLKELEVLGENGALPDNPPMPYRFEYAHGAAPGTGDNPNYITGDSIIQAQSGSYQISDLAPSGIIIPEGSAAEFVAGIQYSDYRTDHMGYFWEDGNFRNHKIEDRWFDGSNKVVNFDPIIDSFGIDVSEPLEMRQHGIEGAKAWSLTKITYPTGATTEIEYEIDRYAFVGKEPTILRVGDGDLWMGLGVEMTPDGVSIVNTYDDTQDCFNNFFDRSRFMPFPIDVDDFFPPEGSTDENGNPIVRTGDERKDYYIAMREFLDAHSARTGFGGFFDNHYIENLPESIADSNRVLHYGGGIRVKQLTNNDGFNTYLTRYYYVNSLNDIFAPETAFTSSGVASSPTFGLRQKLPSLVGYRNVIELLPNNAYVVHKFNSPYEYPFKKVHNFKCYTTTEHITRLRDPAYFWDPRDTFEDTSYMWGLETKTELYNRDKQIVARTTRSFSLEPQTMLEWVEFDPLRPELKKERILPYFITPNTVSATLDGVTTTNAFTFADNGLPEQQIIGTELDNNARVSRTEYSSDPNLLTRHIIDRPSRSLIGDKTKWFNEVQMEYDIKGNLKSSIRKALDAKSKEGITELFRDQYGNTITQIDPNGNKEEIRYRQGYLPEKGWDDLSWSSEQNPSWLNIYDNLGRIIKMRDANQDDVEFGYDQLSRLTKIIEPGDNIADPTTEFYYDSGKIPLMIKTVNKINPVQDSIIYEYFDGHGKLRQSQVKKKGTTYIVGYITYDNMGLPANSYKPAEAQSNGEFIPPAQYFSLFPNADYILTRYYPDPLSRVWRVRPYGDKTIFTETLYGNERDGDDAYDYNSLTIIDENGGHIMTKRDSHGNTIEIKESDLATGTITGNSYVTKFSYDAVGRLLQKTDALGHITRNEYNSLNQIVRSEHPDLGWVEMEYDNNGNLKAKSTPKGDVHYQYDAVNRIVKVSHPDGSSHDYYYDLAPAGSRTSCENGKNQLCMIRGDFGTVSYDYDDRGKITRLLYDMSGKLYTIMYKYDSADNVVSITDPAGVKTFYSYDDANRLKAVAVDADSDGIPEKDIAAYSYNPVGGIDTIQFGNQVSTKYGYTEREWLESIDTTLASQEIFRRSFDFDSIGNIKSVYGSTDNTNKLADYQYDWLYRLTNVIDNGYYGTNIGFTYDAVGNRLAMINNIGAYSYNYAYQENPASQSIKLMSVSGSNNVQFSYDETGNAIKKNDLNFKYDADNRMVCSGDYLYQYDATGKRVKKLHVIDSENAKLNLYIYDSTGNLVFEDIVAEATFDDLFNYAKYCIE